MNLKSNNKNIVPAVFKNKVLILFFFLFLCFLFFVFSFGSVDKVGLKDGDVIKIKINETEIEAEVAVSDAKHYLGLSSRETMPDDRGMIFLFDRKKIRSFVMRDMRFSLDIIFIDENKIVDIYSNLPFDVDSQNISYRSSSPVDKVLEVNGGFCDQHKILIGDFLFF